VPADSGAAIVRALLWCSFGGASAFGLYGGAGYWPLSNFQLYSETLGERRVLSYHTLQLQARSTAGKWHPFDLRCCSSSYAVRSVGFAFGKMRAEEGALRAYYGWLRHLLAVEGAEAEDGGAFVRARVVLQRAVFAEDGGARFSIVESACDEDNKVVTFATL